MGSRGERAAGEDERAMMFPICFHTCPRPGLFKIYTQFGGSSGSYSRSIAKRWLGRWWKIGEIVSRTAGFFYGHHRWANRSGCLPKAFVFYKLILSREYFKGKGVGSRIMAAGDWVGSTSKARGLGAGYGQQEMGLQNKQRRLLARFLIICFRVKALLIGSHPRIVLCKIILHGHLHCWLVFDVFLGPVVCWLAIPDLGDFGKFLVKQWH